MLLDIPGFNCRGWANPKGKCAMVVDCTSLCKYKCSLRQMSWAEQLGSIQGELKVYILCYAHLKHESIAQPISMKMGKIVDGWWWSKSYCSTFRCCFWQNNHGVSCQQAVSYIVEYQNGSTYLAVCRWCIDGYNSIGMHVSTSFILQISRGWVSIHGIEEMYGHPQWCALHMGCRVMHA